MPFHLYGSLILVYIFFIYLSYLFIPKINLEYIKTRQSDCNQFLQSNSFTRALYPPSFITITNNLSAIEIWNIFLRS